MSVQGTETQSEAGSAPAETSAAGDSGNSLGMFQGTPQAESPAPVAAPAAPVAPTNSFDYDRFARAQADALQRVIPRQEVQPKAKAWADKSKFWSIPEGHPDAAGEFHNRLESYIGDVLEERTSPLNQEIQMLRSAVAYLNANKTTDPEFSQVETEVNRLLQSGAIRDVRLAREYALMKAQASSGQAAAAPGAVAASAPRPVPAPPPHAFGSQTRAAPGIQAKFDPTKRPDISKIAAGLMEKEGFL